MRGGTRGRWKLVLLLIAPFFTDSFAQSGEEIAGWASYGMEVTGGGDHPGIRVRDRDQFLEAVSQPNRVILVEDTIDFQDGERIEISVDHLTIEGTGTGAMLRNGGINLVGSNIIVRNLSIGDSYRDGHWPGKGDATTDAITIYGTHIWIDHCELFHSYDGLLDVSSGHEGYTGDLITVSWTRFYNHNKVMLIGSNDNCEACWGKHRVTIHHCWFDGASSFFDPVDQTHYRIQQRMPRVRFGDVHVYNNYYEDVADYAIAARFESRLCVEGNYFRNLRDPHIIRDQGMGKRDPELVAEGNVYDHVKGERATSGSSFSPVDLYYYKLDPVEELPALIMNHAGTFDPDLNRDPVVAPDTFHIETGIEAVLHVLENDHDPDDDQIRIAIVEAPDQIDVVTCPEHLVCTSEIPGTHLLTYRVIDYRGGMATTTAVVVVSDK